MELFEPVEGAFDEGGLMQEGGTVDPESGNEVPVGSTQEEVRDDIPAQLSEGEFVFPADVVRYIGLEKLMQMRQEAKRGLEMMDKMGQMGNSDEAVIPDDVPFDMSDLDMEDDGVLEFQTGGFVQQPTGFIQQPTFTGIQGYQPSQFATAPTGYIPYTAPTIGQPVAQTYTPPQQQAVPMLGQQTPGSFTDFMGGIAEPSPGGYDELKTYVNDAGQEMQIPFKDGNPIYPIPEGFKLKSEAVDTAKTTTTQTTAPASTQQESDEQSDPFAGKNTINLGGTVITKENVKTEGKTAVSSFKPGQVKGTTRYATGTASSKTRPTTGIVAGIKDTVTGFTNQDQRTLTDKFGTTIAMTQDLYDEIIGDRFGSDRQQMLDQMFEVQKGLDAKDGYSKDVDNRMAENLAKQYGIEYKGQSTAQLTTIDIPAAMEKAVKEEEEAAKKSDTKTKQEEAAKEKGAEKRAERESAARAASAYGISPTNPDGTKKSASQLRTEMQAEQKARADAARQRTQEQIARTGGPNIFGGFDSGESGESGVQSAFDSGPSGTDFGGAGYETSTGEAMVAEGGLIKKDKLAKQMKQSGLASKK